MRTGADRIEVINDVQLRLWAAARNQMLPEEHAACKPEPATWDDVEESALGLLSEAERLRAKVAGGTLRESVATQWAQSAADVEDRWHAHQAYPEHHHWLRDGGPARLWDALTARKRRHEETAALVESRWPEMATERNAAAAECQRLMDEMVRLYLGQEAAE